MPSLPPHVSLENIKLLRLFVNFNNGVAGAFGVKRGEISGFGRGYAGAGLVKKAVSQGHFLRPLAAMQSAAGVAQAPSKGRNANLINSIKFLSCIFVGFIFFYVISITYRIVSSACFLIYKY
jgi:hypothetical protein